MAAKQFFTDLQNKQTEDGPDQKRSVKRKLKGKGSREGAIYKAGPGRGTRYHKVNSPTFLPLITISSPSHNRGISPRDGQRIDPESTQTACPAAAVFLSRTAFRSRQWCPEAISSSTCEDVPMQRIWRVSYGVQQKRASRTSYQVGPSHFSFVASDTHSPSENTPGNGPLRVIVASNFLDWTILDNTLRPSIPTSTPKMKQ